VILVVSGSPSSSSSSVDSNRFLMGMLLIDSLGIAELLAKVADLCIQQQQTMKRSNQSSENQIRKLQVIVPL
jgi:hypothetical protein